MEGGESREGMINPENLSSQVKRLENFAQARKITVQSFSENDFNASKVEQEIKSTVGSDKQAYQLLERVISAYEPRRKSLASVWQQLSADYTDKEEFSREVFKEVTGQEPVGNVVVNHTDISIHFQCDNTKDYGLMEFVHSGKKPPERGLVVEGYDAGACLRKVSVRGLRGIVSVGIGDISADGQDTAIHERQHYENDLFHQAGGLSEYVVKPGRDHFWGVSDMDDLPLPPTTESAAKKGNLRDNIGQFRAGAYDFIPVDELVARVVGSSGVVDNDHLKSDLTSSGYSCLEGLQEFAEEYIQAAQKGIDMKVAELNTQRITGESDWTELTQEITEANKQSGLDRRALADFNRARFKKDKSIQRRRVREGVDALMRLKTLYNDDWQMALGLLMPFPMKSWPAVERVLTRYSSKASSN